VGPVASHNGTVNAIMVGGLASAKVVAWWALSWGAILRQA